MGTTSGVAGVLLVRAQPAFQLACFLRGGTALYGHYPDCMCRLGAGKCEHGKPGPVEKDDRYCTQTTETTRKKCGRVHSDVSEFFGLTNRLSMFCFEFLVRAMLCLSRYFSNEFVTDNYTKVQNRSGHKMGRKRLIVTGVLSIATSYASRPDDRPEEAGFDSSNDCTEDSLQDFTELTELDTFQQLSRPDGDSQKAKFPAGEESISLGTEKMQNALEMVQARLLESASLSRGLSSILLKSTGDVSENLSPSRLAKTLGAPIKALDLLKARETGSGAGVVQVQSVTELVTTMLEYAEKNDQNILYILVQQQPDDGHGLVSYMTRLILRLVGGVRGHWPAFRIDLKEKAIEWFDSKGVWLTPEDKALVLPDDAPDDSFGTRLRSAGVNFFFRLRPTQLLANIDALPEERLPRLPIRLGLKELQDELKRQTQSDFRLSAVSSLQIQSDNRSCGWFCIFYMLTRDQFSSLAEFERWARGRITQMTSEVEEAVSRSEVSLAQGALTRFLSNGAEEVSPHQSLWPTESDRFRDLAARAGVADVLLDEEDRGRRFVLKLMKELKSFVDS